MLIPNLNRYFGLKDDITLKLANFHQTRSPLGSFDSCDMQKYMMKVSHNEYKSIFSKRKEMNEQAFFQNRGNRFTLLTKLCITVILKINAFG